MAKKLWEPSAEVIRDANMTQFIQYVNQQFNTNHESYEDLYLWSIENTSDFWKAIWDFMNIIHSQNYGSVVVNLEDFPPQTKWFVGAKLNFAENLLRYQDDQIGLLFKTETSDPIEMSYKTLYQKVAKLSYSLRQLGLEKGDRVAAYMPNLIETVVAMLASASIGAIWSSCGSELGSDAALDRLGQIEPKILFTVDGYFYKGERFDHLTKVRNVVENIPSLEKVIITGFVDQDPDISKIDKSVLFNDFLFDHQVPTIEFEQLPFSHPLYIMFSSGTTGKPKCMVQSAGGVLINHLKELVLHTDLRRSDRILYLTSPSWMMWNWLISSLAVGATVVLFEGNPLWPDWRMLWKFVQDQEITIFGCSASYIHYLKNIGANPIKEFDLGKLREISQTGSTLSEEGFEYVYKSIKENLHLNSISGGTDINGCFAGGSPTLPVYSGQLQARALGMKVKAYDMDANPVVNKQAELVCELPSPSMPIYFWDDPKNEKYKDAYFDFFERKHVWRHGDFIEIHEDTGGVSFYGRSDSVLKPSGVRIGTAEIYNIVEQLPEIEDSLAIGQDWKEDQRILLFLKLAENTELTDDLKNKVKTELRTKASPRHVPAAIMETPDIPYTFSGKKIESAVTNIIHGHKVTNRGAMRNPESLDYYKEIINKIQE